MKGVELGSSAPVRQEEGALSALTQGRTVRQFRRYSVVGLSGFVVDFGLFTLLMRGLGVHYLAANVVAFSCAVINNFVWHKRWTFRDQAEAGGSPKAASAEVGTAPCGAALTRPKHLRAQFTAFVLVSVVGLALNSTILHTVSHIGVVQAALGSYAIYFAKLVATGIVWFWNFGANKVWIFRKG